MRPRWLLYALLFSVAVNIAVVGVLIYGWTAGPPGKPPRMPRPPHHLWDELNLSDEQRAEFDSIRSRYFRDLRPLHEQLREERSKLAELSLAERVDSTQIRRHVEEISRLQTRMELRTLKFFRELQSVLRPEQKEKFREITLRVFLRKWRQSRPRRDQQKPSPEERKEERDIRGGDQHEKTRSDRHGSDCDAYWCYGALGAA